MPSATVFSWPIDVLTAKMEVANSGSGSGAAGAFPLGLCARLRDFGMAASSSGGAGEAAPSGFPSVSDIVVASQGCELEVQPAAEPIGELLDAKLHEEPREPEHEEAREGKLQCV